MQKCIRSPETTAQQLLFKPTGFNPSRRGGGGGSGGQNSVVDFAALKEEQKKQMKRDQFTIEFNTDPNIAVKKLQEEQHLSLANIAEFFSSAEGIRKSTLG